MIDLRQVSAFWHGSNHRIDQRGRTGLAQDPDHVLRHLAKLRRLGGQWDKPARGGKRDVDVDGREGLGTSGMARTFEELSLACLLVVGAEA